MHDTLDYFSKDPIYRKFHHNRLTFRGMYAWHENFVLPLSHDEVVHGKGSLFGKMPGDDWQRFANLRLLFSYQFACPGHKLLFMGSELAMREEWSHEASLDFGLLDSPLHAGVARLRGRAEPDLSLRARAPRARSASGRVRVGRRRQRRPQRARVRATVPLRRADPRRVQLHARGPPQRYRVGVPCEGYWREDPQLERRGLRRHGRRATGAACTRNPSSCRADSIRFH